MHEFVCVQETNRCLSSNLSGRDRINEGVTEENRRDFSTTPGAMLAVGSHSAQLRFHFYFSCLTYS
jgi:hypothetical protein